MPEMLPIFLFFTLATVVGKGGWRIFNHHGAFRTDQAFYFVKDLLIYLGAIAALDAVGL